MELRHLRYFIAIAEEGSLTVAAEKRLHTAQPSLSRQMRDLEIELGVSLMERGARGIELTPAGRVFLDHARLALLQVQAAIDATRKAARPTKALVVGFLTGYELEWLPPLMGILREALPTMEITILSKPSPDLSEGLVRGEIDVAFLRSETQSKGLIYRLLRNEPLIAVMPADHPLAAVDAVRPQDLVGVTLIGVPTSNAPALREVTDAYARQVGVDLTPDHEALNLAMAMSLIASTKGVGLLPLYARNFLPPAVVTRPLAGAPPLIDLSLGYSSANKSPLLMTLLSRVDELKFRVVGGAAR
jgi:LysR family transcriptional regulator, hca operon transcriptional activator